MIINCGLVIKRSCDNSFAVDVNADVLLFEFACASEADLRANAPRVNATPDFSALLGDSRVRQAFQGSDNSFSAVASISSNMYPPVLPQLPRDVQAKIAAHLQVSGGTQPSTLVSNEARAHEIQSKVV